MKQTIRIRDCFLEKDLKKLLTTHVEHENFLFISSTGTGKTTLLHAMVNDTRQCEAIYVNPQEVNIQWIRKKFIPIVKGNTTRKKVLVFDEVDLLLESSQHLIASILEELNCLFYATCCDPHKVIPSIRAKCMIIRLPPLNNELLKTAFSVFFKQYHARNPSVDEQQKVIEYSEGNLTRMKLGIEKIYTSTPVCHRGQDENTEELFGKDSMCHSLHGQSFIDQLYNYISTYSELSVPEQVHQLPIIHNYLYRYYEENHPNLWKEFKKEINVKYINEVNKL